jgi:acyl-phosphate glycerol 3-phosphate acyltransferase
MTVLLSVTILVAYLIGALPFGYLVARARGVDLLRQGSGNIGATNVGRMLGRKWGVLVFVLDFLKGAVPVLVARWLTPADSDLPPDTLPVLAGVAAFLGHLFPVYLGFKGGKGVATGAGVLAVLLPGPTLLALLLWTAVLTGTCYMSLASISAAILLAIWPLGFSEPFHRDHVVVTLFCLVAGLLVIGRHHANVRRLLGSTENRLKDTPAMLQISKVLHVLSLGLWFGTVVFFSVVGLVLFDAFDRLSVEPAVSRPIWFPLPPEFARDRPSDKFPNPLAKEQGSRAVGYAVAPLFPIYSGIQAVCAVLATVTAAAWWLARDGGRLAKVRTLLLMAALVTVGVGWYLERVVHDLREPRNEYTDQVLKSSSPTAEEISRAEKARAEFGRWHGYSLMDNFATLALVTAAMILAAWMPVPQKPVQEQTASKEPAVTVSA